MSRLRGTLMEGVAHATGREGNAPQVDTSLGGQFGYQPSFDAYVSNTGYTPRNVIPILIEAPRGFQYLPDPQKWIATLKALIENQSKQITGLTAELTVEVSERPIGQGGHQQRDPTKVTETIPTVTHVWDERDGSPILNFWESYIRNLIEEPTTGQPGLMNLTDEPPSDRLADMYSFTTLYIVPDPLRRFVVRSWMDTNMFPLSSGSIESQYDATAGQEVPELSVEMAGIPVRNQGVDNFAQQILDGLNYVGAGPMQRPAFVDQIQADVTASEQGYVEGLSEDAQTGI